MQPVIADLLPRLAASLVQAHQDGLAPEELQRQMEEIGDTTGGVTVDVGWEPDGETGAPQYDVVVMAAGVGTFLVSYGPDDDRPWALRGAHHSTASTLAMVGDWPLLVDDAVGTLELLWTEPFLTRQILSTKLLHLEAKTMSAAATEAAVTDYVARFRRSRRLFSGAAFDAWLADRGMTPDLFEERVRGLARVFALRQQTAAGVAAYFAEHRGELAQVTVARWWFAERERADALRRRLAETPDSWSLLTADPEALPRLEVHLADDLPPELREGAPSVVGPLRARGAPTPLGEARWQALMADRQRDGFCVYRVLERREATLDRRTREALEQRLFDAWVDRLRARVPVTWSWGRRTREGQTP